MTSELRPCPFCGKIPFIQEGGIQEEEGSDWIPTFEINCTHDFGEEGETDLWWTISACYVRASTPEKATEAWNRRGDV